MSSSLSDAWIRTVTRSKSTGRQLASMKNGASALPAGYSGTPLAKKLGIKERHKIHLVGAPANYRALLEPLPPSVKVVAKLDRSTDVVHLFATERAMLAK